MLIKTTGLAALLSLAAILALPAPVRAEENDATTRRDLLTVLTLKGKPCGEIVDLRREAENDYLVTCGDGHRYRIFIGADDRVVVEDRS
jgi:hypothetical protein